MIRGGYGVSYVHFSRAGGGDLLPINGPQVVNAVINQTNPTAAVVRAGGAGLSGGPRRSVAVQPADGEHHLHAARLPLEPGAELVHLGAARAASATCCSTSPTSATAPTTCCCSPTTTRRCPTTPPARSRCRIRRPIPAFADITYAFNGGKSRYKALQTKFEWRMSRDLTLLSSLTLSETKDNGSQSLENSNGNFPAPQDFRNLDADFGLSNYHQPYNSTTSFVWALPFGRGRRWGSNASPIVDALIGGWQLAGDQQRLRRRAGDVHLHAGRDVRRLGHRAGLPRREQLPAQRDLRSVRAGRQRRRSATGSTAPACRSPTDPSQPFGNAQRNTVRGPTFWQFDLAASKRFAARRPGAVRVPARGVQPAQPHELPLAERQPERGAFGTITSTYDPRQLQLGFKLLW